MIRIHVRKKANNRKQKNRNGVDIIKLKWKCHHMGGSIPQNKSPDIKQEIYRTQDLFKNVNLNDSCIPSHYSR
jgi:hypothetical protein